MRSKVRIEATPIIAKEALEEEFFALQQATTHVRADVHHTVRIPASFGADSQHLHERIRSHWTGGSNNAVHLELEFVHNNFGIFEVILRPPSEVDDLDTITTREIDMHDIDSIDSETFAERVIDAFRDRYETKNYVVDFR